MKSNIVGLLFAASMLALNSARAELFPNVIPLPESWGSEGIASGRGTEFYAGARQGSPFAGAIYKGDLRTGEGDILIEPQPGRFAFGLKYDRRTDLLFVAGGPSGAGFIYDASTGEDVAVLQFASGMTFVNDVIVTRTAAYFTDSLKPVIYSVPLGPGGRISDNTSFTELSLTGDFALAPGFNANGIAATPNGKSLFIVQSNTGLLFRVDPQTGETTEVDLGGNLVTNGDGILLDGHTLYVVRNQLNRIAVVELDHTLIAGNYVGDIVSPEFIVPSTIAEFGNSLYAVNARFADPILGTEYQVVRVSKQ